MKKNISDELCIQEYIKNGGNKTDAYRHAFPKRVAKWKSKTIHEKACAFFKTDKVQARLREIAVSVSKQTEIDAEYVTRRFHELESFDFGSVLDPRTGAVLPIENWPDAARRTIIFLDVAEIFEGRGESKRLVGYTKRLRIEPRSKALESIAKNIQFYPTTSLKMNLNEDVIDFLETVSNSAHGSPQARLSNRKEKG